MIARDQLRLAAARLAAEYVSRAAVWAHDVDEEVVLDLERVHQRIVADIHDILARTNDTEEVR
jgi:ferredoxin-fold anticodon binding domain-containing protein